MKYQELVDVYSALEATTKRLEKTDIIAEYLKKLDADTIGKVGLLLRGGVFPAWSSEEIGIGSKLVERAVAEAVGTTQAKVEDAVRDEGDIGLACVKLYANKSQMTFFSQPLTINFVFDSLRKLSATTALLEGGEGLSKLNLTPGTPVKPMLAQLSPPVAEIIPEMGTAICETKYDGIRLQKRLRN